MDQLEEIKSKIDIVSLIQSYFPIKKAGRNYKSVCPFHSEDSPSFVVSPERQIFKCFGCGEGGDIFGFVMKYEHMEFGEALKFLADKAGVRLEKEYHKQTVSDKDYLYQINQLAADFFHYLLTKESVGEAARAYLKTRAITSESVERFHLGYAPNSWDLLGRFLQKKGFTLEQIDRAGLVVKKSNGRGYYDRFRARLMFPVYDLQGNVVGFSGRILIKKDDAPKYLNTPETPLYNKSRLLYGLWQSREVIRKNKELILTEGNVDIVSAHQGGVDSVVAPLGTALTLQQVQLIKRYAERAYLCFDADLAGDKASRRGIPLLSSQELEIKVIELVGGNDIDECLRKNPKFLAEAMPKAVVIYDFYLASALRRYSTNDPFGKQSIARELIPIFAQIPQSVLKAYYLQKLSQELDIPESEIFKEAEKVPVGQLTQPRVHEIIIKQKSSGRHRLLSEYLLTLSLQKEDLTLEDVGDIEGTYLEGLSAIKLWERLIKYLTDQETFSISGFYATLEPEETKIADNLYLLDISYLSEEEKQAELVMCKSEVKKIFGKKELNRLKKLLRQAESKDDEAQTLVLQQNINEITSLLQKVAYE